MIFSIRPLRGFMLSVSGLLLATALGCAGGDETNDKGSTDESSEIETGIPLYLQLSLKWEGASDASYVPLGNCTVSASASRGSTTNCNLSVEEARLYFSDVRFTVGTLTPNKCAIVAFFPYWYRRSTNAAYTPPGETTAVDCSGATTEPDPKCYGGAAPTVMSGEFPNSTGRYFVSELSLQKNFDIAAENTVRWYGGYNVNYLIANDLTNKAAAIAAAPKTYVGGNAWTDYTAICMDRWGYPVHTLKIVIQDEDKDSFESHAEDNFTDWD